MLLTLVSRAIMLLGFWIRLLASGDIPRRSEPIRDLSLLAENWINGLNQQGGQLKLIQRGKPTQNAFIESFNGKFRNECLNEHWFHTLDQARVIINQWRKDYNECRPHSMFGYKTPAEMAEILRNHVD